jgi:glycosyltransferase involved in cell wall biosynthesis
MKILLASYFVLPNPGGIWTYVQQLRRGIENCGHEVDLMTHSPDFKKYVHQKNGSVFYKSKVRELVKARVYRSFQARSLPMHPDILEIEIERYVMEMAFAALGLNRYDLIHTQDIISTRAAARVKPAKTPLVATIHGSLINETIGLEALAPDDLVLWEYLKQHEYLGVMSSDEAIMPSVWLKNVYVHQFGVPDSKMSFVSNGIDIDLFRKGMKEPLQVKKPRNKKVIICNARLSKVKGHVHLFAALAKLKADYENWVCWLVGDGEIRDDLLQIRQQFGLEDDILFLGNRNDVPTLLKAAHICVLPSLLENCPYAVMEAHVAGTPIIASNVGGISEMIQHKKTGLLISLDNPDALYHAIKKLLKRDRMRKTLGKNAREWGRKNWSIESMTSQTIQVYQRAIDR